MLDTKEILKKKNPPPPPVRLPGLERGEMFTWDLDKWALAMDTPYPNVQQLFSDGRSCNPLIGAWMNGHGFTAEEDKQSGWLMRSDHNHALYRIRVCKTSVNLRPPISSGAGRYSTKQQMKKELGKIDGWALVFVADLPEGPIWFLSKGMSKRLQAKGFLDDKFTCRKKQVLPLREFLNEAEKKGLYREPDDV